MDVDDLPSPDNNNRKTTKVQTDITNATDNNTRTQTISFIESNTHDASNKITLMEIATSDTDTSIDDNEADKNDFANSGARSNDEVNSDAEKVTNSTNIGTIEANDSSNGLGVDELTADQCGEVKEEPYYFNAPVYDNRIRSETETSSTDTDDDVGAQDIIEYKDEPMQIGSGYDSPLLTNEMELGELQFSNAYSGMLK